MRPLSIGELLDASFSAVKRNFGTLALCTLVAAVPVAIVNTLVQASTTDTAFDFATSTTIDEGEAGAYIAGLMASALLSIIAFSLATAACLRTVGGDVVGARVGAGESLRYAAKRLGPLLWVSLLYALALIGGVFLLIVGAIWLGVLFSLSTPALLFEDKRGVGAMQRSAQLIARNWWRVFGVLLVMYLIVALLQGLLVGLLTALVLVGSENEVLNAIVSTLANIVGYAVSLPLVAALSTYIYFDLRVRKEGFDIQMLAQRIGSGGESAAPAAPPAVEGLPARDERSSGGFLPPQAPPPAP